VMLIFCTYQVNGQDRPKGGSVEGSESFGDTSANAFPNCGIINYAGKTYHTVVIGAQCWMRENLNVGSWIDQSRTQKKSDSGVVYKYCFSNDFTQCDLWGGLYQWDMLMNYTTAPGGRGICPEGWHVPTSDDLYKMIVFLGGNDVAGGKLKTTGSRYWKIPNTGADNSSGFTAMPAGYYDAMAQRPQNRYLQAAFWSSTKVKDGTCVAMFLNFRTSSAEMDETLRPEALSARCIKDQ
jgi:uncharacterized protein (TIGR02145 family)